MPPPDSSAREGACLFAADEDNLEALLADDVLDGATEPCPLVSQIVEVGFADQATQAALFGDTRNQYVNLSRVEVRQADSDLVSDNQIGHTPPLVVRVTPARATTVRVKLTRSLHRGGFPSGSSNLSSTERSLSHLQYARGERSFTTDANGQLLLEPGLPISALGGGEYRVEAALPGQGFVAGSNSVKAMRRVYLRPVRRYAHGASAAQGAMNAIRSTLRALGIEVKLATPSTGSDLGVKEHGSLATPLENLGAAALRSPRNHVRELRPHSVAVIVGEFICDPITPSNYSAEVRRNAAGVAPTRVTVDLKVGADQWFVLVPLDDGSQFVHAVLTGGGRTVTITDAAKVTGLDCFNFSLEVDITDALASMAGVAVMRLTVRVKAISRWAVGWAYNDHPVIYLNMRDPNSDTLLPAVKAQALMIHELGHKLHLAASGEAGQPDAQAHHYPTFDSHGVRHQGPHCSTGVTLPQTDFWKPEAHTAATCTMWGSLKEITSFCDECKTTLRKVNLGDGF